MRNINSRPRVAIGLGLGLADQGSDKGFSVATGDQSSSVAIGNFLSWQGLMLGRPSVSRQCDFGAQHRVLCVHDGSAIMHYVVHCFGNCSWTLNTNTIFMGHC